MANQIQSTSKTQFEDHNDTTLQYNDTHYKYWSDPESADILQTKQSQMLSLEKFRLLLKDMSQIVEYLEFHMLSPEQLKLLYMKRSGFLKVHTVKVRVSKHVLTDKKTKNISIAGTIGASFPYVERLTYEGPLSNVLGFSTMSKLTHLELYCVYPVNSSLQDMQDMFEKCRLVSITINFPNASKSFVNELCNGIKMCANTLEEIAVSKEFLVACIHEISQTHMPRLRRFAYINNKSFDSEDSILTNSLIQPLAERMYEFCSNFNRITMSMDSLNDLRYLDKLTFNDNSVLCKYITELPEYFPSLTEIHCCNTNTYFQKYTDEEDIDDAVQPTQFTLTFLTSFNQNLKILSIPIEWIDERFTLAQLSNILRNQRDRTVPLELRCLVSKDIEKDKRIEFLEGLKGSINDESFNISLCDYPKSSEQQWSSVTNQYFEFYFHYMIKRENVEQIIDNKRQIRQRLSGEIRILLQERIIVLNLEIQRLSNKLRIIIGRYQDIQHAYNQFHLFQKKPKLKDLSDFSLLKIFQYVTVADYWDLWKVCERFNQLTGEVHYQGDFKLWHDAVRPKKNNNINDINDIQMLSLQKFVLTFQHMSDFLEQVHIHEFSNEHIKLLQTSDYVLPNVHTLRVRVPHYTPSNVCSEYTNVANIIAKTFPNIDVLSYEGYISDVFGFSKLLNLEYLELYCGNIHDSTIENISSIFQLCHLNAITIQALGANESLVNDFCIGIKMCANILKEIAVSKDFLIACIQELSQMRMPCLRRFAYIDMEMFEQREANILNNNLLQPLAERIYGFCSNFEYSPLSIDSLNNLRNLEQLIICDEIVTCEDVQRLTKYFPHLTDIQYWNKDTYFQSYSEEKDVNGIGQPTLVDTLTFLTSLSQNFKTLSIPFDWIDEHFTLPELLSIIRNQQDQTVPFELRCLVSNNIGQNKRDELLQSLKKFENERRLQISFHDISNDWQHWSKITRSYFECSLHNKESKDQNKELTKLELRIILKNDNCIPKQIHQNDNAVNLPELHFRIEQFIKVMNATHPQLSKTKTIKQDRAEHNRRKWKVVPNIEADTENMSVKCITQMNRIYDKWFDKLKNHMELLTNLLDRTRQRLSTNIYMGSEYEKIIDQMQSDTLVLSNKIWCNLEQLKNQLNEDAKNVSSELWIYMEQLNVQLDEDSIQLKKLPAWTRKKRIKRSDQLEYDFEFSNFIIWNHTKLFIDQIRGDWKESFRKKRTAYETNNNRRLFQNEFTEFLERYHIKLHDDQAYWSFYNLSFKTADEKKKKIQINRKNELSDFISKNKQSLQYNPIRRTKQCVSNNASLGLQLKQLTNQAFYDSCRLSDQIDSYLEHNIHNTLPTMSKELLIPDTFFNRKEQRRYAHGVQSNYEESDLIVWNHIKEQIEKKRNSQNQISGKTASVPKLAIIAKEFEKMLSSFIAANHMHLYNDHMLRTRQYTTRNLYIIYQIRQFLEKLDSYPLEISNQNSSNKSLEGRIDQLKWDYNVLSLKTRILNGLEHEWNSYYFHYQCLPGEKWDPMELTDDSLVYIFKKLDWLSCEQVRQACQRFEDIILTHCYDIYQDVHSKEQLLKVSCEPTRDNVRIAIKEAELYELAAYKLPYVKTLYIEIIPTDGDIISNSDEESENVAEDNSFENYDDYAANDNVYDDVDGNNYDEEYDDDNVDIDNDDGRKMSPTEVIAYIFPNLHSLHFWGVREMYGLSKLKELTTLELHFVNFDIKNQFLDVFKVLPLQDLTIVEMNKLFELVEHDFETVKLCKNMERLTLCPSLCDVIAPSLHKFPKLREAICIKNEHTPGSTICHNFLNKIAKYVTEINTKLPLQHVLPFERLTKWIIEDSMVIWSNNPTYLENLEEMWVLNNLIQFVSEDNIKTSITFKFLRNLKKLKLLVLPHEWLKTKFDVKDLENLVKHREQLLEVRFWVVYETPTTRDTLSRIIKSKLKENTRIRISVCLYPAWSSKHKIFNRYGIHNREI